MITISQETSRDAVAAMSTTAVLDGTKAQP
jgi:hypothetical protein